MNYLVKGTSSNTNVVGYSVTVKRTSDSKMDCPCISSCRSVCSR